MNLPIPVFPQLVLQKQLIHLVFLYGCWGFNSSILWTEPSPQPQDFTVEETRNPKFLVYLVAMSTELSQLSPLISGKKIHTGI